jgi:hypothetical protein
MNHLSPSLGFFLVEMGWCGGGGGLGWHFDEFRLRRISVIFSYFLNLFLKCEKFEKYPKNAPQTSLRPSPSPITKLSSHFRV